MRASVSGDSGRLFYVALVVTFAAGIALRIYHPVETKPGGLDEYLYKAYVEFLSTKGLLAYPSLVAEYVVEQTRIHAALLPPTRFSFIFFGYLWHSLFGGEPLAALRAVACFFNCLAMLVAAAFTWRAVGRNAGLAVAALMACAPMQLFMS